MQEVQGRILTVAKLVVCLPPNAHMMTTSFVCHTSRRDGPRPSTSIDMLGIMGHMDLLHQSDRVTIQRNGSVVLLREGAGPST